MFRFLEGAGGAAGASAGGDGGDGGDGGEGGAGCILCAAGAEEKGRVCRLCFSSMLFHRNGEQEAMYQCSANPKQHCFHGTCFRAVKNSKDCHATFYIETNMEGEQCVYQAKQADGTLHACEGNPQTLCLAPATLE